MPDKDMMRKVKELLTSEASIDFFINELTSPDWLTFLKEEGVFLEPPNPIIRSDGTYYPSWSASKFLVKIAELEPTLVVDIAKQIPETANFRVYEDILDIALKVPVDNALELISVEKARILLDSSYEHLISEKLAQLLRIFAGSDPERALGLAKFVFAVTWRPEDFEYDGKTYERGNVTPAHFGRGDTYHYIEEFKACIQPLIDSSGIEAVKYFLSILNDLTNFQQRKGGVDSTYTRLAIEDHEQNREWSFESKLIGIVRAALEYAINSEKGNPDEIIKLLSDYETGIFKRLELHLLRKFPKHYKDLISDRLGSRELFDSSECYHEYAELFREQFQNLPVDTRELILGWIINMNIEEWLIKELGQEDAEKAHGRTQLDWLSMIKDNLTGESLGRYKALDEEFPERTHRTFHHWSERGTWGGPESPKTTEEILAMSVEELVGYLKGWKGSMKIDFPPKATAEGFGRSISDSVTIDPQRFATKALLFQEVEPTYVSNIIYGFQSALKGDKPFDWCPVLALCLAIAKKRGKFREGKSIPMVAQLDWTESRKRVASLLREGFGSKNNQIPFNLQEQAWQVLEVLSDDPHPSQDSDIGSGMDGLTLAINSVRGTAFESIIQYALWCWRHILDDKNEPLSKWEGMQTIPEVRTVLEHHLDPEYESWPPIRSIYGQWFAWFDGMDHEWAEKVVDRIFPTAVEQKKFRDAAWDTYLLYCPVYDNPAKILLEQYEFSLDEIANETSPSLAESREEGKLAEHFMIMYWRGLLGESPDEGLTKRFWEVAPLKLRQHAISFIGYSMHNIEEPLSDEIKARLKELINHRIEALKDASESDRMELAHFGQWFLSDKLDQEWILGKLVKILELTDGQLDTGWMIVKRLAELAGEFPDLVIDCLSLILPNDRTGWVVLGAEREVVPALKEVWTTRPKFRARIKKLAGELFEQKQFGYAPLLELKDID